MQEQITTNYGSAHSILTHCSVNRELVLLDLLKSKCAPKYFILQLRYAIYIDVKIRYAIRPNKAWNWAICAAFSIKVMKIFDYYYTTAVCCQRLLD